MFSLFKRRPRFTRRGQRRVSLRERIVKYAREAKVHGFTDADATRIADRVAYYAQQHWSIEQTLPSPKREEVLAAIAAEESRSADGLYRTLILERGGAAAVEQLVVEKRPRPNLADERVGDDRSG